MDPDNAIEVSHVHKFFTDRGTANSIKDVIVYHKKQNRTKHEVLKDISFNVRKGEILGIIGRNGSGKSTMLKLLTKILRPNSGTISTNGHISCLIELGAGFHPDMTGRENLYINGTIFGLNYKQIDERYDDIVAFSEIGDHINERVRNYSSGMYMRLAFSVAINVDADILLIDEILAVGDVQFQDKCYKKIMELRDNGTSIVLVTHSTDLAKLVCNEVMWLDDGEIRAMGDPETVCNQYLEAMKNQQ